MRRVRRCMQTAVRGGHLIPSLHPFPVKSGAEVGGTGGGKLSSSEKEKGEVATVLARSKGLLLAKSEEGIKRKTDRDGDRRRKMKRDVDTAAVVVRPGGSAGDSRKDAGLVLPKGRVVGDGVVGWIGGGSREFMKSTVPEPSQKIPRVSCSFGGRPDAAMLWPALPHKGLAILPRRDRSRTLPWRMAGMINEPDVSQAVTPAMPLLPLPLSIAITNSTTTDGYGQVANVIADPKDLW
ncbi:hypothetical protein HZH66_011061 [Vespula vulgaris]|uniref:Uncharacterized protein n=1 Tax=Vespula vulgaris TaxID=7454 RepID=A0A834JGD3_VESVU|nr:hypothetical protein HZH66_011061 [Vespula vulgaris]